MAGAHIAASVAAACGRVVLADKSITDDAVGATASCSYSCASDGQASEFKLNDGGTLNHSGEWYSQVISGIGAGYEIQFTVNSGSTPTGSATGSFLALSTGRSWTLTRSTNGTTTCNATITIRAAGGGATVATCTVVMTATRIP